MECVRKEVAKRKLKGELLNRRVGFSSLRSPPAEPPILLEDCVRERLAKLEELKHSDRINLLDLFVHN